MKTRTILLVPLAMVAAGVVHSRAEAAEAVADTSIISGDVSVSATVTLEFSIR